MHYYSSVPKEVLAYFAQAITGSKGTTASTTAPAVAAVLRLLSLRRQAPVAAALAAALVAPLVKRIEDARSKPGAG
jgi:H+/gluconate symporter-like permease